MTNRYNRAFLMFDKTNDKWQQKKGTTKTKQTNCRFVYLPQSGIKKEKRNAARVKHKHDQHLFEVSIGISQVS